MGHSGRVPGRGQDPLALPPVARGDLGGGPSGLGRVRELAAQVTARGANLVPDLLGEPAHRLREVRVEVREVVLAGLQLGAARLGDPVDGLASGVLALDEPLLLEA